MSVKSTMDVLDQAEVALSFKYPFYYHWMRNIIWQRRNLGQLSSGALVVPDLRVGKFRALLNQEVMADTGLKAHLYAVAKVVTHLIQLHGLDGTPDSTEYRLACELQAFALLDGSGLTVPLHPHNPHLPLFPTKAATLEIYQAVWDALQRVAAIAQVPMRPTPAFAHSFPPAGAGLPSYMRWVVDSRPTDKELELLKGTDEEDVLVNYQEYEGLAQDQSQMLANVGPGEVASTRSALKSLLSSIASDVQQFAQPPGGMSGGVDELIRFGKKRELPWWDQTRKQINTSLPGSRSVSLIRQNRRGEFPGRKIDREIHIVFALDGSGSMLDKLITRALNVLISLGPKVRVDLIVLDTQVTEFMADVNIKQLIQAGGLNIVGRGGTDLNAIIAEVRKRKLKPDLILTATDGTDAYPRIRKALGIPSIFLIMQHYITTGAPKISPDAGIAILVPPDPDLPNV